MGAAEEEPGNGLPPDEVAEDGEPAAGTGDGEAGARDPVERLLALLAPRLDEVRSLLDEAGTRWRGDAIRVGEGTRQRLRDLFRELGLVTRDDWDELELRVAQLEHRLRLVEDREDGAEEKTS